MKKLTVFLMSLMLVFSLAACSNNQQPGTSAPYSEPTSEPSIVPAPSSEPTSKPSIVPAPSSEPTSEPSIVPVPSSEPTSEPSIVPSSTPENSSSSAEAEGTESTSGKTLVVYFSASGNTEKVTEYIAAATGADVFELEPTDPYTDDDLNFSNDNSRVVYEHDNPEARTIELVATTVPDWDSYDTVFIGYPIWWGNAAWPVDGFIEANDFMGKTVIPFCTSLSSGLGESGALLAEQAGTGNWLEGQRFPSSVSEDAVQKWIASLNQ